MKAKYFIFAFVFAFLILSFYYYGIKGIVYQSRIMVFGEERNVPFPEFKAYEVESFYNYAPFRKFEFSGKKAIIIIDNSHENDFKAEEISALLKEIADANADVEFINSKEELFTALRYADAFITLSPNSDYDSDERLALKEFADKGGRILITADPGKGSMSHANSLSLEFGISFNDDYIYNLKENAGNFRYVIFKELSSVQLMEGVNNLIFFVACSISSDNNIAYGGGATKSSSGIINPSPVALEKGSILAICDQSFLSESYSRAGDNRKFISNIANFLASGKREFYITDFPEMYYRKHLKIIYLNESLLDKAIELKNYLQSHGIDAEVYNTNEAGDYKIFIGTYSELSSVLPEILKDDFIEISGIKIERNLSSIFYLEDGISYIAGNDKDEVSGIIDEIKSGSIYNRILRKNIAVIIHKRKEKEEAPINESYGNLSGSFSAGFSNFGSF